MAIDIVLNIPLTPEQGLYLFFTFLCFIFGGILIIFRISRMSVACGYFLLLTGIGAVLFGYVVPSISSAMPTLPPVWQDAWYVSTHPGTWFNITVIWPNGGIIMFESVEVKSAGKCPHCGEEMVKHIIKEGARYHVTSWDSMGEHCSEPKCEINHRCGICTPIGRERRASRVIGRDHDPRVREIVPVVPEFERVDLP